MIPDWAKGFIPDGLQSTKQLASYGANLFFALLVVQVLGLDLTRWGMSPVVDWRTSGALFLVFAAAQYRLGGVQDAKLQARIGNGTQPPSPPAQPGAPFDP